MVNLVEERSCEALVSKLQRSKSITKGQVLNESEQSVSSSTLQS